jgi:PAT family beta-lactamase induction signal transducer AmpG
LNDHTPARRQAFQITTIAALLYFSEGFPFGFVTELLPLYLRKQGVALETIGLVSAISIAWTLKVFWAPLIDLFSTYRRWIIVALLMMAGAAGVVAVQNGAIGAAFWIAVGVMAVASATQDIAADALTLCITPPSLLGPVNSIRVTSYRLAMIASGAALAALSGFFGWRGVFIVAAVWFVAAALASFLLPPLGGARATGESGMDLLSGIRRWITRDRALLLFMIVLLYRVGDSALAPMVKPFWIDRGYSATEVAAVTTAMAMTLTIAGAIAGGAFVKKFGIYRGLLVLGVLQMLSNGGYALAAFLDAPRSGMYAAAVIENFTGGLGTAGFLAFLMAICDREHAATEYAAVTAIYGLSRSAAGALSGYGAHMFGYGTFFTWTLLLGCPGLLLVAFSRDAVTTAALANDQSSV